MTASRRPGSLGPDAPHDPEDRAPRVLFVCTGNTCRSPMAQEIARRVWGEAPAKVDLRSAGLAASESSPASAEAISVGGAHGEDLSPHRSHQITADDLDWADLVLTMTGSHRDALLGLRHEGTKIRTLAEFAGAGDLDVADPFGGSAHDYEAAHEEIESYIRKGTIALESWWAARG